MINHLTKMVKQAFFSCYLCRLPLEDGILICNRCQSYFEANKQACQQCAMPIADSSSSICGQCQQPRWHLDKVRAPWRYAPPLSNLICDFKYEHQLNLAGYLAELILTAGISIHHEFDCLIPMPIHRDRLKQRGFNQALLLGKIVSKKTGITLKPHDCTRQYYRQPQASLNYRDRQQNSRNAFKAKPVNQQSILILDDLITTGATANALAKELKRQGARRVELWCIARQF